MADLSTIILNIAQSVPGFLMAIVFHEAAHAYVAYLCGDNTAKDAGRMSLNPAVHYDPWGTVFFPLMAAFTGFAVIGWARPVPINVRNFKNWRKGVFWVSFAGPLANILLGTLCAFVYALVATQLTADFEYYHILLKMLGYSVLINFILAFFNLLPIPPLDGSKMVSAFLKGQWLIKFESLARFTPLFFIGVIVLSFMGISTIGHLFRPAQAFANGLVFTFLHWFGV